MNSFTQLPTVPLKFCWQCLQYTYSTQSTDVHKLLLWLVHSLLQSWQLVPKANYLLNHFKKCYSRDIPVLGQPGMVRVVVTTGPWLTGPGTTRDGQGYCVNHGGPLTVRTCTRHPSQSNYHTVVRLFTNFKPSIIISCLNCSESFS